MQTAGVTRVLRVSGLILSLLGLGFIANRLLTFWDELLLVAAGPSLLALFLILGVVAAANLSLLALGWRKILLCLGAEVNFADSVRIYGQTLLARYIPGNVFQFVARQTVGVAEGIPGGVLARSAFWEIGLIATSGALFSFLLLPLVVGEGGNFLGVVAFLAAILIFLAAIRYFFSRQRAVAFLLQTIYLAISGVTFLVVMLFVVPSGVVVENGLVIVGAFVVAWLVGLLTPGAPGGLGVREATLVLLLGELNFEGGVVAAVVMSRLVHILGDVLFFGVSLRRKPKSNI